MRDLRDSIFVGNLAPISINFAQTFQKLPKWSPYINYKYNWKPSCWRNTLLKIMNKWKVWWRFQNFILNNKIDDFWVFHSKFVLRKWLLLIIYFEDWKFLPNTFIVWQFSVGTESRKSRSQNLARFNLALKFDLARDLRDFRNPSYNANFSEILNVKIEKV